MTIPWPCLWHCRAIAARANRAPAADRRRAPVERTNPSVERTNSSVERTNSFQAAVNGVASQGEERKWAMTEAGSRATAPQFLDQVWLLFPVRERFCTGAKKI